MGVVVSEIEVKFVSKENDTSGQACRTHELPVRATFAVIDLVEIPLTSLRNSRKIRHIAKILWPVLFIQTSIIAVGRQGVDRTVCQPFRCSMEF